jgi:hypothetical protein
MSDGFESLFDPYRDARLDSIPADASEMCPAIFIQLELPTTLTMIGFVRQNPTTRAETNRSPPRLVKLPGGQGCFDMSNAVKRLREPLEGETRDSIVGEFHATLNILILPDIEYSEDRSWRLALSGDRPRIEIYQLSLRLLEVSRQE